MINTILAIAAGGAAGALARHGMNTGIMALVKTSFPYGILSVNILGSFLMGAAIALFAGYWNPGKLGQLFFVTGFLGAFTTFSTFSLDTMTLITRGDMWGAMSYVAGSVVLSITAVFLGTALIYFLIK